MSPSDLGTTPAKDFFLGQEEEETVEVPRGNDLSVLEALGSSFEDDAAGKVSFQGIRRRLGIHQETLSRVLHRLEREGLVSKSDQDYKISRKGSEALGKRKDKASHGVRETLFPIPILRTILPPNTTEVDLENALSHKWFGSLRWYGSSHGEDGTTLTWTTDDGKLILSAKISDDYLAVESQATTRESMQVAIRAAYEIFDHVSRAFKYRDALPLRQQQDSPSLFRAA